MRGYAALGLYYPKTPVNVGGVLRAAGCYGAAMVVMQGNRFKKTATDVNQQWKHTPLIETEDLMAACPYGCVPVAIELSAKARALPSYTHPERAYYIFGPEDGSVPVALMERCRDVVQVPTEFCMNLAATANVVLYDRLAKVSR